MIITGEIIQQEKYNYHNRFAMCYNLTIKTPINKGQRKECMRNEQGFFKIDQALIRLKNGTLKNMPDVTEIREEIEILKKYVDYTDTLVDKLKRRNTQIADLKHKNKELNKVLNAYDRYIQEANDDNKYVEGWFPVCIDEFKNNELKEGLY